MVCYSHLLRNFPQIIVIHRVKGSGIINKAEVDVFLELFCFFYDTADVGNLISDSSAFSKSSLNIWKFMVRILLKPVYYAIFSSSKLCKYKYQSSSNYLSSPSSSLLQAFYH